jgi:capsular polysaccharide transport system permease protein
MILTVGVMLMWGLTGESNRASVGVIPFALTGYTVITLWRHMVGHFTSALQHNMSLMFHRNVHYIDTLISRTLLEIASTGLSFLVIYIVLYVTNFIDSLYDPYLLLGGYLLSAWFSLSVALNIAGLKQMYPVVDRFIQPLMYLSLPVSGLFFMIAWLPVRLAQIVKYSPLALCFELVRHGVFGHKVDAYWDAVYIIKCNIVLTAIGLLLVRKAQQSITFE